LTPGESTTFTVRLDADAAGTFAGNISIASNAAGQSSFSFHVTGAVYDPTAAYVGIIDDGSAGNSRTGSWTHVTSGGYSKDEYTAAAGKGTSVSTWTFGNLANGDYRIQATWKPASSDATNAPFSLLNGSQLANTVHVNERLAPNDQWDGGWFENLGTITVTNHQLVVKLTNAANGMVAADAIRIEKVLTSGTARASLPETTPQDGLLTELPASGRGAAPDETPLPAAFTGNSSTQQYSLLQMLALTTSVFNGALTEKTDWNKTLELISTAQQSSSTWDEIGDVLAHELALQSILQAAV
jgi:hypothetical protein